VWGAAKKGGSTTFSFTVLASRHAISHALVIKTAVSVLELAGFTDLVVGVSSVGDAESKRRFLRELQSFFRKHAASVTPETLKRSHTDPEAAYRDVLSDGGEAAEKLPRPIDFLSENSRKTMVDTLHLFEAVGIEYELQSHLPSTKGVHAELLFAISAVDHKGQRVIAATGGRMDELMKKSGPMIGHTVGLSVTVPESVDAELPAGKLSCFVVHVGEAAKLKSFSMIEALWRADVSVRQALMAESLRDQMDAAKAGGAKFIAIVGQREALDGTVLVRNVDSGTQQSLTRDKLASYLASKVR
jgi:histidyl-tRNA synthetase